MLTTVTAAVHQGYNLRSYNLYNFTWQIKQINESNILEVRWTAEWLDISETNIK